MTDIAQFDNFLTDNSVAALVIREPLMAVEGADGVVFPATFASGDGFDGGYNIDTDAQGRSIALIDSVGSQANRIEPIFKDEKYQHLVPQIVVQAGEKQIHLLDAGHRAGDAIVRCSSLQSALQQAFREVLKGSAAPLAKLAPTSLVFGVWDSRDTQAKLPRVIASTIRAFQIRKLRRSAQYNPATDYIKEQLVDEPADKSEKDAYSVRGFTHVPATATHGGIIADGGIRRDATLGLAAIRLLRAGADREKSRTLQRYILGLSLVAFTHPACAYLRQGCTLVRNPSAKESYEFVQVYVDGRRVPCSITHEQALEYATAAANEFGVGDSQTVPFERDRARNDVSGDGDAKATKKSAKKGAKAAAGDANAT